MRKSSFENLQVWKRASQLAVDVYNITKNCSEFSFRNQIFRAAVSIASNIAEGAERGSEAEFNRFLNIAKGSAAELRTQLYISQKAKILEEHEVKKIIAEIKEITRMIQALQNKLEI